MNMDSIFKKCRDNNKNTMVPWYLLASYLYYHKDESLLTDNTFDKLCVDLLDNYESITHIHKHLINKEDLKAGSCFLKEEEYPLIVKYTADSMIKGKATWLTK